MLFSKEKFKEEWIENENFKVEANELKYHEYTIVFSILKNWNNSWKNILNRGMPLVHAIS